MTVNLRKTDPDHLAAALIARLDDKYDLVYVDYRDQMTDAQVDAVVSGDMEKFWDETSEFESESRWYSCDTIIKDLLDELFQDWNRDEDYEFDLAYQHARLDFDHSEARDELRYAIEERDESDWPAQLARNTPRVLLRIAAIDEDNAFSFEPVDAPQALGRAGLPMTEHNLRVMADMLPECSPEYSVLMGYWIVGADVSALYNLDAESDVEITNPYLYLGNPFAGSGYISDKPFEGTVRVARDDVHTDKGAFGYSVDEIHGGLYASQFEADIKPAPKLVSLVKA